MSAWLTSLAARWPEVLAGEAPTRDTLQTWLAGAGSHLRVIPPEAASRSYEECLHHAELPTRDRSWHDTFNVLSFIRFPSTKLALHERVRALQRMRPRGSRGPEEDALTLLDEATLVIGGTRDDLAAIRNARALGFEALHDAVARRRVRVECFGHALLEHLKLKRSPIGAGVFEVELHAPEDDLDLRLRETIGTVALDRPRFSPTVPWPDPRVDAWATP